MQAFSHNKFAIANLFLQYSGCHSPNCICCNYAYTSTMRQAVKIAVVTVIDFCRKILFRAAVRVFALFCKKPDKNRKNDLFQSSLQLQASKTECPRHEERAQVAPLSLQTKPSRRVAGCVLSSARATGAYIDVCNRARDTKKGRKMRPYPRFGGESGICSACPTTTLPRTATPWDFRPVKIHIGNLRNGKVP